MCGEITLRSLFPASHFHLTIRSSAVRSGLLSKSQSASITLFGIVAQTPGFPLHPSSDPMIGPTLPTISPAAFPRNVAGVSLHSLRSFAVRTRPTRKRTCTYTLSCLLRRTKAEFHVSDVAQRLGKTDEHPQLCYIPLFSSGAFSLAQGVFAVSSWRIGPGQSHHQFPINIHVLRSI